MQGSGVDLTGVRLSDLVRLYLERIDDRSYVACAELVEDGRKVSLRSNQTNSRDAIVGLLEVHGYAFTERAGVTYVCPAHRNPAPAVASSVPSGSPLAPESAAVAVQAIPASTGTEQAAAAETRSPSSYEVFAEGGDTLADRLAARGFVPAGCVQGMAGKVRVAFKSEEEGRTQLVDLDVVRRSQVSDLVICRI